MRNNYQSKAVPRGTRTIWRYLGALFILFTFAIGNVWADLTAHTPGVYEKTTDKGGYGATIVTVSSRDYEVYGFSYNSSGSKPQILWAGTSTNNASASQVLCSNLSTTPQEIAGWISMSTVGKSSTYSMPSGSEFAASSVGSTGLYQMKIQGHTLTLKIKGYDQFSLLGNDNNADKSKGKYLQITINGVDSTKESSTSTTIRRFSLSASTEYTITITAGTGGNSHIDAFSLRLPACTKPAAPTALSCTAQTVNTLTFGWTKEANAVGYVAKLYSDSGCETEVDSKDLGNVNTVTFTGLSNSTTYYCKVQSKGNGTTYCEGGNVTAAANGTTETPTCGVVTAPTSLLVGATTADGASFTIIDDADAFNYEFYVSESSTEPESSATSTHTSTEKTKDVTGLTSGTTYYAWVRSVCDADHKSAWTAANKSFKVRTTPTASFADANYIIGMSAINVADNFTSNSGASVVYELKESYPNVTLSGSSFSATAAGEYVVVANQAGNADYTPISKEATVTVLDNELTDLFIWKNGTGFGGDDKCVSSNAANGAKNANQNQASTALNYSSSTLTGMTSIGRPSEAGNVTLTFAVTNAYSSLFGIKSICAFGKIEEPAGIEYSWNNTDWTAIAGGESDDKKYEFTAPAGTFPTSLYIRFTNAVAGEGGLWLRNALVTLQAKKTVASTVVTLNNVMVNTEAISSANLSSLLTNKSLAITTEYAAAPTVTFVKRTTVNYEGGWAADETDEEIDVTASDASTVWSASQEIGENTYAITLAKPSEPSLETAATGFTLTSTKNATAQETFTFSGLNLDHSVAISLASEVAGMSVSPAVVNPVAGAITDEEVTISYKSLENVAEANVNLIVSYSETVKLTIPLTYSSTKGWDTPNNVTGSITWDFSKATSSAVTISNSVLTVLANYNVENDPTKIVTDNLAGKGEQFQSSNLRTFYLQFTTTVNGKLSMDYSNTGSSTRPKRYFFVNGVRYGVGSDNNTKVIGDPVYVPAGLITLEAKIDPQDPTIDEADWVYQNLQLYKMVFTETHDITFVDGGSIAAIHAVDGETVSLPAVDPSDVPTGKLFIGWYIGEDKVGDAGDDYTMGNADVEMTAKFSTPAETPVINAQPVGSAYCAGSEPTLTVDVNAVSDGGTLHYAWYKKGETDTKVGSDAASYTVETAGTYYVIVTNQKTGSADASVTSENAVVTMNVGAEITAQPAALQVVSAGDAVELSVTATNATGYQWYKGGVLIEGAQAATYNFTAAVGAATYYCVVTGACGDVQSNNAVVYVESGDCNTIGYDGTDNTFGTSGTEYTVGSYTKYKYSKSANTYTIDEVSVTAYKLDGKFYFWTPNTEIAAISTSVLTDGTTPLRYCVVFYDEAKFEPADEHIISVVEETAGLKNAAQKINVTVAPAGAKCARVVRSITWNETSYGQGGNNYIYAARVCAIVPAEKPVISGDLSDLAVCTFGSEGLSVTVDDVSDGGTLSYQWYNADGDVAITGEESASYTPMAEGTYYVIVTNTLAGSPSSSTKSAEAEVSLKAATAITAYANAAGVVGAAKTLSVTATGAGTLTYQWQACDENGNVTDPAVLGTDATYAVTITADPQYYLATVHGDCGDLTQVLSAKEWTDVELQDVTGSMTWNFTTSNVGLAADVEATSTMVLANAGQGAMPNNANFRSDMLVAIVTSTQTKVRATENGGCYQGTGIKFHTTVPGIVTVEYRGTGNSADVTLTIGSETLPTYHGNWTVSKKVFVPAGEVEITSVGTMRIKEIVFNATPDYERDVTEGKYGTICLPNGGVMVGAAIFEIAYMDYMNNKPYKIYFDEVLNGTMEAGMPYIFLPNEAATQLGVFYTDAANAPASNHNGLYGSYTKELLAQNAGNYILKNNQYYLVNSDLVYVGENRAYIYLAEVPNYNPGQPAPGRRRVSMNVNAEQTTTDLENLSAGEQPMKMVIDGKLFILRGEKLFDATGRLVK